MQTDRFIQIDEEGVVHLGGEPVTNPESGKDMLKNLWRNEKGRFFTKFNDTEAIVEAFDEPLIAKQVFKIEADHWEILFPYGYKTTFQLNTLSLDEWDRFHGHTENKIPFVFSRAAQNEFFNLLDEFTDETITANGQVYNIPDWLYSEKPIEKANFWSQIYTEQTPPWDLGEGNPILNSVLPQLNITKSRIIVPGCGAGHDAAHLAQAGHIVTGVDISEKAIEAAKEKYGNIKNLTFIQDDIFNLDTAEHQHQYDIVFEHTCYCAINPNQRNNLVKLWKKLLVSGGHLLGIFFAMDYRTGPPFGGSEWEVRQRLKKDFQFLYWTRWRHSIERRMGKEFVVYAKLPEE